MNVYSNDDALYLLWCYKIIQYNSNLMTQLCFRNELTCQICTDVITDLDEWLVSEPTETEIVDFVKEVTDLK